MTTTIHGGKGSKQRPTNKQAYDDNYDRIFRKKREVVENDSHLKQSIEGENNEQNGTVDTSTTGG